MLIFRINILGDLFKGQLTQGLLILAVVGALVILAGLFMLAISLIYKFKGEAVSLRVHNLHHDVYEPKDDDSAEKIARKAENPRIRPEFVFLDGPHAGHSIMSSSASSKQVHDIGDVVQGRYIEQSGEVASDLQLKSSRTYGSVFIAVGLGLIGFALFMTSS